jgi:hypothetical protein
VSLLLSLSRPSVCLFVSPADRIASTHADEDCLTDRGATPTRDNNIETQQNERKQQQDTSRREDS